MQEIAEKWYFLTIGSHAACSSVLTVVDEVPKPPHAVMPKPRCSATPKPSYRIRRQRNLEQYFLTLNSTASQLKYSSVASFCTLSATDSTNHLITATTQLKVQSFNSIRFTFIHLSVSFLDQSQFLHEITRDHSKPTTTKSQAQFPKANHPARRTILYVGFRIWNDCASIFGGERKNDFIRSTEYTRRYTV